MTSKHSATTEPPKGLTRRHFLKLGVMALASAPLGCLAGCADDSESKSGATSNGSSGEDPKEFTLFVFDTVVNVSAYCTDELLQDAQDRCKYFESTFSRTVEGSDIWNINHAKGKPVEVSTETADIIAKALAYSKKTDGLFDITIGAVSTLWDFDKGIKPSDDKIKEAVRHVGYRSISLDGQTVRLSDPKAKLDLGAIAKGYIADDLARILREGGCESACINLGGNVYVLGSKPSKEDWTVGVYDPNGNENQVIASCKASNKSIVTSGLYERNFTKNGTLYYHILDTKTGYPAKTDLIASSIYSDSSIDGDVYATVLFLLGHNKALKFLKSHDGLDGLVVDKNDKVSTTKNSPFKVEK